MGGAVLPVRGILLCGLPLQPGKGDSGAPGYCLFCAPCPSCDQRKKRRKPQNPAGSAADQHGRPGGDPCFADFKSSTFRLKYFATVC